jgi:AcrR family transcriptional regulator
MGRSTSGRALGKERRVADAREAAFSEPGDRGGTDTGALAAPIVLAGVLAPEAAPKTGRRPGRPRDTNSDETRARILEAALDAFADRGYDGVSTREIARQAEVTSATVYHHFPSKFSLYQDAYRYALDVAFSAHAEAVAGHDSVMAEIDAMLDCSLRLMHERVAITSLAIHAQTDAVHPEMRRPQLHDSARAVIDGMTLRAIARGELDPRDAVLFERMLMVFLWGLSMAGLDDEAQRVECVDALRRLLDGTLLRRPSPPT